MDPEELIEQVVEPRLMSKSDELMASEEKHTKAETVREEKRNDGPLYKDQVREMSKMADRPKNPSMRPVRHGPSYKNDEFSGLEGEHESSRRDSMGDAVVARVVINLPVSAIAVVVEDNETGVAIRKKHGICFAVAALVLLVGIILISQIDTNRSNDEPNTSSAPTPNPNTTSPPSTLNPKMVPIAGCEDALPLFLGDIVNASTMNETVASAPACGNALPSDSPGVWFKYEHVPDDETWVRITTCTDDESLNGDFDSQMIVYTGACDSLQCFDGNDNDLYSPCGLESGVTFRPDLYPSGVYYVLVNGRKDQSAGSFGVQAKYLSGEKCENAVPLQKYHIQSGSTVNAMMQTVIGRNDVHRQTSPGVWYVYQTTLYATTAVRVCRPDDFPHDHRVDVLSGKNCDNRESIGDYTLSTDGFCQVTHFFSEPSMNFFILVSALSTNATGDFSIEVYNDETEAPTMDVTEVVDGAPDPACSANPTCAAIGLEALALCCPTSDGELLKCCEGLMGDETEAPTEVPPLPDDPQCDANPTCAALNITGLCCPTQDGLVLDCCGGEVEEICEENPKCVEVGLTGECCSTPNGKYLDCCEVVPSECTLEKWENYECGYDSRKYLAEISPGSGEKRTLINVAMAGISVMYLLC